MSDRAPSRSIHPTGVGAVRCMCDVYTALHSLMLIDHESRAQNSFSVATRKMRHAHKTLSDDDVDAVVDAVPSSTSSSNDINQRDANTH